MEQHIRQLQTVTEDVSVEHLGVKDKERQREKKGEEHTHSFPHVLTVLTIYP